MPKRSVGNYIFFGDWNMKKINPFKLFLGVAFIFTVMTGCGKVDVKIEDLNSTPTTTTPTTDVASGRLSGIVAASIQDYVSPEGFHIQGSVGNTMTPLYHQSATGWKIYSSVQGNFVSDSQ